ncbi:MAG: CZB domain-containing protein [Psychromonas sp.]|nr:CZB domain-containing protein [Psychromonas sp.]
MKTQTTPTLDATPKIITRFLLFLIFVGLIAVNFVSVESTHYLTPTLSFLIFVIIIAYYFFTQKQNQQVETAIEKINLCMLKVANGQIYERQAKTAHLGVVQHTATVFNNLMDTFEAYFKETEACFEAVSKNNFSRRPFTEGLAPYFARSLQKIDKSIDLMQQAEQITRSNRLSSGLHQINTKNLITNLTVSQNDLIHISEQIKHVNIHTSENSKTAHDSAAEVRIMKKSSELIQNTMEKVEGSLVDLEGSQEAISSAMKMITDITDQTTLLALNASIEAARAGEHGRGFAVVADEVKALSIKTKQTAEQISNNLKEFSTSMAQVSSSIHNVNKSTSSIVESINQVSKSVDVAEKSSFDTESLVKNAENYIYSALIKVDHIIYKQHAYRALGNEEFTDSIAIAAKNHHECRFGQWYDRSETIEKNENNRSYHAIKRPHKLVHSSVSNSYKEACSVTPDENQVITQMEIAEKSSAELIDLLSAMVDEQNIH